MRPTRPPETTFTLNLNNVSSPFDYPKPEGSVSRKGSSFRAWVCVVRVLRTDKGRRRRGQYWSVICGTRSMYDNNNNGRLETHLLAGMLGGDSEMQGILYMPQSLQTGSSPPNKPFDDTMAMDMSTGQSNSTKEAIPNQSSRSDSGIFSTTNNSSFPDEPLTAMSNSDSDNRSDCSSPDRKYLCPICETMLTSQHEFTLHIRSHNNSGEEDGFTCRICFKVLSSSSSLDRHVLVHTGERPFTCKFCGDTFTTNGNMHRHMRTHKSHENYESDGASTDASSTGSARLLIESNNNEVVASKRKLDQQPAPNCKKIKQEVHADGHHDNADLCNVNDNETETDKDKEALFKCPICSRNDFASRQNLEIHVQDNHPDYPSKCQQCSQVFENNKQLNYHKNSVHVDADGIRDARSSVVGFKDLTFVDFSSKKFPYIARYECEKNLHIAATGLKFLCDRCSKAFPCATALDIHRRDCLFALSMERHSVKLTESDIKRADFFARLDLQNNVIKDEPASEKDLADIPSILSLTKNMHIAMKAPELQNHPDSSLDGSTSKMENEEETQDMFAQEFRKMKLRGEFPCRLCTAIFPNLRALKGHNRQHLNGTTNGTYRCNMCPHFSVDKAALIRHMRTHNGDRPYECSLCNYAFTTKANCERHLRNRHSKSTREEVKKSIIYHPSEDPTNDDLNKLTTREDKNDSSTVTKPKNVTDASPRSPEKSRCSSPKPVCQIPSILQDELNLIHKPFGSINDIIHHENIKSLKENLYINSNHAYTPSPKYPYTSTPQKQLQLQLQSQPQPPQINVKHIDSLKAPSVYNNSEDSMDVVLDLSKKKTNNDHDDSDDEEENHAHNEDKDDKEEEDEDDGPQDLTKKTPEIGLPTQPIINELLAQQFLKTMPKFDPASLYHYTLIQNLAGLHPTWNTYPFNPFLFPNPMPPHGLQDMKKRLQGGGEIINNHLDNIKSYQPPPSALSGFKMNDVKPEAKYQHKPEEIKPLSLNIDVNYADTMSKLHSPIAQQPKTEMQSPNSVKMVIKNGVLMPKQKQRRYRTERPFSCDHCSARFTLRSNMERHIKQQHPQFWSQRQRSNVGTPGRKSQNVSNYKNSFELNIPMCETAKLPDYDDSNKEPPISDKLKYAILAQHLRSQSNANANVNVNVNTSMSMSMSMNSRREEDEEGGLIINEKDEKNGAAYGHVAMNGRIESEFIERAKSYESKLKQQMQMSAKGVGKQDEPQDLASVSRLLNNASQQQFKEYFRDGDEHDVDGASEEDEEGLVASGSSEGNSGTDENKSESETASSTVVVKKKSAYSLAPNRISCQYCDRKFPWSSSLRRHILTHTGQKPFKCSQCPLLFTTKSNCDRHLLRKHGNTATTICNDTTPTNTNSNNNANNSANNTPNYLMRNVPERPYKCSNCPSSTFSTYSNLKKHMSCKHVSHEGYEGSSEDEKQPPKPDWEAQIQQGKCDGHASFPDLPFKCHLCEGSFVERQDALDHIREKHVSEYELLVSKNALDSSATTPDDLNNPEEEESEIRGKFPDYSNRKVICAFCMRRFWSAEDLRRHMRTHTGERPFSCDICRRRFTLKHSMLRHRKKHDLKFEADNGQSDEDVAKGENNNVDKTDESDCNEGGDLISNLLGIRDRAILDKVLTASADDAAKLLGVKNGQE